MSEANNQVTKQKLPEHFSTLSKAVRKLKKAYTQKNEHIEFLMRRNQDLRESELWRANEMERQEFEIWKLKLLLSEAGYDPQNLPQPKGLTAGNQTVCHIPLTDAGATHPQNGETSTKPLSPFMYKDPTPKRKRTEHDDGEYNPNPKRRALPLAAFLEVNTYACEDTYTQYLVNNQLEHDTQDKMDEDEDEDEDEEEESSDEGEYVEVQKKETNEGCEDQEDVDDGYGEEEGTDEDGWDSVTAEYLRRGADADEEDEDEEGDPYDEDEAPRRSARDEQYLRDLEIAIERSLEDMDQNKGKDEGGEDQENDDDEDEDEEDADEEDEEEGADEEDEEEGADEEDEEDDPDDEVEAPRRSARDEQYFRDLEIAMKRSLEDMAQKGRCEGVEDQEDDDNEGEDEEDGPDGEGEAPEFGSSDLMDEDEIEERSISESSEHEPVSGHNEDEDEGEDGGEDEDDDGDGDGDDDGDEEAPAPKPAANSCSEEQEEAEDASSLSAQDSPDFQCPISLSLQTARGKEKERGNDPASKPVKYKGGDENEEKAPVPSSPGYGSEEEGNTESTGLPSGRPPLDPEYIKALLRACPREEQGEEGKGGEEEVPTYKSSERCNDDREEVEARGPLSKKKYSEIEYAITMSLESLMGEDDEREAEQPAFRVSECLSEDYDVEEAPVPEPFEYYTDNEEGVQSQDSDSEGERKRLL